MIKNCTYGTIKSKSKATKWQPPAPRYPTFLFRLSLQTSLSLKQSCRRAGFLQTTCLNGHLHVMSHTFPQLIQTATAVVVQISMSDLACDVVLVRCHLNKLVRHGDSLLLVTYVS